MKVLIIGASGMLARPVVNELSARGFNLRLFSRSVDASMFRKDHEIVNGDVNTPQDLQKAVRGCDAIHVSLSGVDEAKAIKAIAQTASEENVRLISMVSGCTVAEENRWFSMIENKFQAEKALIDSGIPYLIFRATWFFESLELMVRNGKAMMIGKQKHLWRWIAARDFACMVGEAYQKPDARNKIYYVLGNEPRLMKDLLEQYCAACHPEIKKISSVPTGMLKLIATLKRNRRLREVADMFGYFEKTREMGDPAETYTLLGEPKTSFENWLQTKD